MKAFWTRFIAVLHSRNKEFVRDRSALGWNILFPVLVVLGFGFAFSGNNQDIFKVAVSPGINLGIERQGSYVPEFFKTQYMQFINTPDLEGALAKLKRHQLDMVVQTGAEGRGLKYWINETSPKGYLIEKVLLGQMTKDTGVLVQKQTVHGQEIRYVDWLISGLLAMNMMFSALFGVGYNIVRYRKNGVLKRLKATPLRAYEFLLAQVASRLILLIATTVVVYVGCDLLIHFRMQGSYVSLFIVLTLGSLCLISLGILMASRTASEEFAGGILNLVSWPMMFLSGVWFSLEGAHPWVQKLALAFPLTHMINSARAIMTEGATLAQVSPSIFAMIGMTAVFLIAGSWMFRWR
jgi:ABC-type multidrug transport system permease subunit